MKSSLQVYTTCSENYPGAEISEIRLCLLPGMREAFEKSISAFYSYLNIGRKVFIRCSFFILGQLKSKPLKEIV